MIEVKGLTKRYGDHLAVDHLSFCVEKGQVYGFLGANGAGKSTTMNMLTGYIAPTEGEVIINGKDIMKEPEEAKKSIGYLPELPPVYMEMTVQEYLEFVAQLKKVPKKEIKEQLTDIMKMTGVEDVKGRLIKNLSKGYRQRVGLAQAIVGYPEVIILDEPTVGLDPKQLIEIRELIRNLSKKHTILLSSHILSEVSAVCDHILIISHGKLVASDSPEGLEKQLQSEGVIKLTVKGSFEALKDAAMKVSEVESVEESEALENSIKAAVTMKPGADCREELFYALADAKLPILELQYEKRSLEDIFLELTGDNKDTEEPDAEEKASEEKASEETDTQEADTEETDTEDASKEVE